MALGPSQVEATDRIRGEVSTFVKGPMAGLFPELGYPGFYFLPHVNLANNGGIASLDLYLAVTKTGFLTWGEAYRENPLRFAVGSDERWRFDITRPTFEEAPDEMLLDSVHQPTYRLMRKLIQAVADSCSENNDPQYVSQVSLMLQQAAPFLHRLAGLLGDPSLTKNDPQLEAFQGIGGRLGVA